MEGLVVGVPEYDIYKILQLGENMQQVLNVILAVVKKKILTPTVSNMLHCRLVLGFHSLQTVAAAQVSRVVTYFFFIANDAHHHFTWLLVTLFGKVPTQFPDRLGVSSYYLFVNFPMWSPYKLSVRLNL